VFFGSLESSVDSSECASEVLGFNEDSCFIVVVEDFRWVELDGFVVAF
jgi:hypothetical protein